MKPILQELYENGICPDERPDCFLEERARRKHASSARLDRLAAALDKDTRRELDIIIDDILDDLPYENCELFIYTFQLGARIMLEVMTPLQRKKP